MTEARVLMILTSHAAIAATGKPTGFCFEQLATPYYELVAAGVRVELASPKGGLPPVDPEARACELPAIARFRSDGVAMKKLRQTKCLCAIDGADYEAVVVAGGRGAMWDLAGCAETARLLGRAAEAGRVVAAICHGAAALLSVRRANGEPWVKGRRIATFSNEEEWVANLDETVPFLLESRLRELGALYERGSAWSPYVVRDGTLVTGQNPQSAAAFGREVLAALSERRGLCPGETALSA